MKKTVYLFKTAQIENLGRLLKIRSEKIFTILVMVFFMVIPFVINAQATFNLETGTGTGTGWSWTEPLLTINDGANITVTGQVTDGRKIEIAAGANANVTISNVYISGESVTGGDGWEGCPILLNSGATVNLILDGINTLKAGHYWPGISASLNTTLTIEGTGSLDVTGGWSCAAIGGGLWTNGPCGTITINSGIITAKGAASSWIGTAGAGIGGGAAEPSGNITINGGVVAATDGGGGAGMGIGNGGLYSFGTLTMNGSPIVFSNRVGDMSFDNKTGGILVAGNSTFWYGDNNFSLTHDVTVPSTNTLTINEGKTLTIPAGVSLTNNGVIFNYSGITINGTLTNNGTIINISSGSINGTVSGNAPITGTPLDNSINLSTLSTPQVGNGWVFANNVCTILNGADVTVTGTNSNQRRIEIAAHATANITLNDVSITGLGNNQTPMLLNSNATLNLTIEGNNTFSAGRSRAALQAAESTTLTINGTGSLTTTGGTYGGAAIGGAFCEGAGTITINSGTITANAVESGSYCGGAGIGGGGAGIIFFSFQGVGGTGGDITINGGVVTANGYTGAAGIGGGGEATKGGTLAMNGNGVVFVSSLINSANSATNTDGIVNGILFNDNIGTYYGESVTLTNNVTIPNGYSLIVPEQAILTIPAGKTLHNNGMMREENGTIIFDGTFTGNKILFSNIGGVTDTEMDSVMPINIASLFTIYKNAGAPIYTIETGSTGEGTIVGDDLTVIKTGEFIIGLVTAEAQYYAAGEKVTSTLIVEPYIGIENLSHHGYLKAYTNNGWLHVNGLIEGKIWSVYNISGALIYRDIARDVKANIPLLTNGLFIIHSEGMSIKVINN